MTSSRTAVLLGAQRFDPTLSSAVKLLGVKGRFATITCGWQERENDDDDLTAHLGGDVVNLRLHARATEVFAKDPELARAHREKQVLLRHLQEIYRIRLDHAQAEELDVAHYDMPERMRDEVIQTSIEAIQALDARHIQKCASVRQEFDARMKVSERAEVVRHHEEIARALEGCTAVAIAGGHVAVLLNRLVMFGIDRLIGDRPVFAWSAGAMAITDRIVLFHDNPPQGQVAPQILDAGLGLVPNAVVFPTPERRLNLDDNDRVSLLARRFAPAVSLVLPDRSFVAWTGTSFGETEGVMRLANHGAYVPFKRLREFA